MDLEEKVAWLVDPEAFSHKTRVWEAQNPHACSNWENRRQHAHKTARQILAFLEEEN